MKKHFQKRTVHENEKPSKCDICQSSFRRNSYMITHKKTVHEKEKPFKCEFCQSCFGTNRDPNQIWYFI